MDRDPGLDVLLELHGTEYTEESGYWYKIEARLITPTIEVPHGIRYNLTLHDKDNNRIMGFDNAHAPKPKKGGKYKGRVVTYDHLHANQNDTGTPYVFSSAGQLMKDFFEQVNSILKSVEQ